MDRTKCPWCGVELNALDHPLRMAVDYHFEDAHGLERFPENHRIVCLCGAMFKNHDQRVEHLWSVTDWPAHITLGVLKQL